MIKKIVILVALTLVFCGMFLTFKVTDIPASIQEDGVAIQDVRQGELKGDEIALSVFGKGFSPEMRIFLKDQGLVSSSGFPSWGLTLDMEISGNYLYVANNLKGFTIIDISDPTDPNIIVSMETENRCWNIEISGNYLYSLTPRNQETGTESQIEIFDISNKSEPFLAKILNDNIFSTTFKVDKNTLYVAAKDRLIIYDVENIEDIQEVKVIDVAPKIRHIEGTDNSLFVSTRSEGLYKIDTSDYSISNVNKLVSVLGFAYSKYLYIVGSNRQLMTYDLEGELLGSFTLPSDTYKLLPNGRGGVYISLLDYGVQEYTFNGTEIIEGRAISAPNIGKEFEIFRDYCFVPRPGDSSINVLSLNPEGLFDKKNYVYVGNSDANFVESESYVYVGLESKSYKRIDLKSGKAELFAAPEKTKHLHKSREILFNYNNDGLYSSRVALDGSLNRIDSIPFTGTAIDLVAYGTNLFLLDKNTGIRVVKYSDVGTLTEVWHEAISERAYRISQFKEYLAVSKERGGIDFFDIIDPDEPRKISSFKFPVPYAGFATAWETSYHNDKLYVAAGYEGVFVLSVKDPSNPFLIEIIPSKSFVLNVQISNELLYFSEFKYGLTVYMLQDSQPPVFVDAFPLPIRKKFLVLNSGKIMIMTTRAIQIVDPLREISDFYAISSKKLVFSVSVADAGRSLHVFPSDVKSESNTAELDMAIVQN